MKTIYTTTLLLVAAGAFGLGRWHSMPAAASGGGHRILYYRDPMHPEIRSDKPGTAADCGMALEPVYEGNVGLEPTPPGTIRVSPEKQQLIGIRTAEVQRESVTRRWRMPGHVAVDELRIYRVALKAEGWVRQIYPVTTGTVVQKGQPLVTVYGKDYRMAQQSYIYALNALDKVKKDQDPTRDLADSLEQTKLQVAEALTNLQNMWVDPGQIEEVGRTRQAQFDTRLAAPADGLILVRNVFINQKFDAGTELYRLVDLSRVWIVADLFSDDAPYVRAGGLARVSVPGYPGRTFAARVSGALPQFDTATRTLKLRLEVDNPGSELRPDMIVDVSMEAAIPPALTIPADAIVRTGLTGTVFVDHGNGYFEPRTIETGWHADHRVQVLKGLKAGERVVAAATFLLDSESRLQGVTANGAGAMRDPVCGMTLDPAKAKTAEFQGALYHFCSERCRRLMEQAPERYVDRSQ
jgi:Cu(I)/Ag(I) efflux system membrane fusion protein